MAVKTMIRKPTKRVFIFITMLGLMLMARGNLCGQTTYASADLLQPLDNTGGSARAMALGSAFVGVADDSSALFWNPAGLGSLRQSEVAIHHNTWLVDTLQESLVASFPVKGLGGFGAMVSYLDYGTFQGRDSSGNPTPSFSAGKFGFMAGWGKEWAPGFSAGLALRGNMQTAHNQSFGLISGDVGLLYSPDSRLRFGAALANFGGNQAGGWVASAFRAGVSFKPDLGQTHGLLLALGGTLEPQGVNRYGAGVEYSYQSRYFLRAGYQLYEQDNEIQGFKGLTAGVGIHWFDLSLDYAFLPYGDLGISHRISLGYSFPGPKENKVVEPSSPTSSSGTSPAVFKPAPGTGPSQNKVTLQFEVPPDEVAQGRALEAQGRLAEAMKLYQDAVQKDAGNASAWYALGRGYYQLKQKDYAVRCLEQVLKLQPDNRTLADWLEKYKASQVGN
jgi:hypothetical protein